MRCPQDEIRRLIKLATTDGDWNEYGIAKATGITQSCLSSWLRTPGAGLSAKNQRKAIEFFQIPVGEGEVPAR